MAARGRERRRFDRWWSLYRRFRAQGMSDSAAYAAATRAYRKEQP